MIPVEKLLYKIDMKFNKVASLTHQEIPLENKILALNEAQIKLIISKLDPDNAYGLGFDAFKKRYEDLSNLVEQPHAHILTPVKVDTNLFKWQAALNTLTPKYMFYVDAYAIANKGDCTNRVIYVNHDLSKHSDVPTLFANNNTKPSFEYQETFDTISNGKIEIYSDGTFDFTQLYVSYLRYPLEIDLPGYTKLDGTPSVHQDSELADYLEAELINFTLLELGFNTENTPVIQATQERIKTQE